MTAEGHALEITIADVHGRDDAPAPVSGVRGAARDAQPCVVGETPIAQVQGRKRKLCCGPVCRKARRRTFAAARPTKPQAALVKPQRSGALPGQIRTLHFIDPGHEDEHRVILRGFGSEGAQIRYVREMLVEHLFAKQTHTQWARAARVELRRWLGIRTV